MSVPDLDEKVAYDLQDLRIQRQIAFASGLFQENVTVRTLLESLAEGVVIIDNSGTILLVNACAEKMFGYPKKDLIGKPHSILIPERFRKNHEEHEAHYFEEPKIRPMGQLLDLAGLRQDGSEFPLEISLSFLETINGVLVIAFISDITIRTQYELHLRESDDLFHIQVEAVKDYAIFMLDTQGNVLNWNAGAERLKGYRAEEIIGKHFSCFYTEEDLNAGKPHDELKKAASKGRVEDFGWRVRKDGNRFWADVIITALRDDSGKLRGFSKVTRDITRRKKDEEALLLSEARYRALFVDNPTMIFTIDANLQILSANPSSARQLGYIMDELEGQPILKVFHEDDHPAVIEQFRACMQHPDKISRWHFRKVRKDGGVLWVEETAQAVYDLDGSINVLVVCQDITERKQAEEERERLLVQLEAIQNSINDGVVVSDLEGNVLTVNKSALAIHDFESIEQARMPLDQYQQIFEVSDLDGNPVLFEQWPLCRAIRGERFADCEVRIRRKDTGRSWIGSYSGTPVQSKTGDFLLALITMRDITERKQTEAEIQRLASYPVLNPNPILELNTDGQVTFCNPASKQILEDAGYDCSSNPFIPEDMPVILRDLQDKKAEKNFRVVELGGRFFEELICNTPSFQSVRIYTMDITERKRAEEEITRLNLSLAARSAMLEDANLELEAFNYSVAHDLRNPLNIVSSYCQAIKEFCGDKLDEQCLGYLQQAFDGTLRMNQLIGALLDFSRLIHVEPKRNEFDISNLVREVSEEIKLTEPERRVTFRIAEGITVNGDVSLLRVVLTNLLGNALKYTGKLEEAVIEFGANEIDGQKVCFIKDNGIGFDMVDAGKLFTPFQRLPGAEECRGFGVGLATVERIIRRLGGRIWAESEPGKGATFYFTLGN